MKQLLDAIQNNKVMYSSDDTILKEETTAKYLLMSTATHPQKNKEITVCLSSRMFQKSGISSAEKLKRNQRL
jgi:hypothetical protein